MTGFLYNLVIAAGLAITVFAKPVLVRRFTYNGSWFHFGKLFLALMEPIRIVEKKGNKYLVEWKGNNNKNSWETKANLGISYRLFVRSRIIFQNENIRTVKTFPTLPLPYESCWVRISNVFTVGILSFWKMILGRIKRCQHRPGFSTYGKWV